MTCGKRGPRDYYSQPRPGTKIHAIVLAMLSHRGLTSAEARELGLTTSCSLARIASQKIDSEYGYLVRALPCRRERCGDRGRTFAYRIVGKTLWNGTVIDFLDTDGNPSDSLWREVEELAA
jgi:hypothetical protein